MKIVKRIIWGIVIFFAIVYVLPATLLQIPYFQKKVSHQISSYLTKKLKTEVQISQIELGFFNKLVLKDAYMEDQSGAVLFQAKRVAAGFDFLPLLRKKLRFNSIQLFTFQFNLSKETDGSPLNIQYIIDAFAKTDTTATNTKIDLSIENMSLRAGSFSYLVKDKAETPGKFNPKRILVSDIFSKIQIYSFKNDELDLRFDQLSFKEQSGLQMKNAAFDLTANEKMAKINQLTVDLNKSSFVFTDISADYNLPHTGKDAEKPLTFRVKLKNSTIYPQELSAVVPVFSYFDDRLNLEGDFTGDVNNLSVKDLYFRYYNQIMISANADLRNVFHPKRELFYIRGNISNSFFSPEGVERFVNSFSRKPVKLPEQIKQMKNIRFEGNVNGSFDDLTAQGILNTGIGIIKMNLTLEKNGVRLIKGQIASESVDIEKLFNNKDYGEMAFDINLNAKQGLDNKFSGSVDANIAKLVYKGYTYQNLTMEGEFTPKSFLGRLNLNSPEGKLSGEGLLEIDGKDSKFDFSAKISDLQLDKLNLTKKYKHPLLSFGLKTNLTGDNPDNFIGSVSLNNLLFETDNGSYSLDSLKIASTQSEQGKKISIDSEILSGKISGNYSFKTIIPAIKQTFARYLPSLVKSDPKYSGSGENKFSIDLKVNDLTKLSKIFELPFSLQGQTDISGKYSDDDLNLDFFAPKETMGGSQIDSLRLVFAAHSKDDAQVGISGINLQKKGKRVKFAVKIDAANDMLNTSLHWGNGSSSYHGELNFATLFSKSGEHSPLRIETNIQQTDMIFNDSIWRLDPVKVVIDSSNISINHLQIAHNEQYLKINGLISANPEDELQIELNRMDLGYIFQSLDIPALEFGGLATGFVKAQDLFRTRKMETNLDVTDFSFNSVNFGHLNLTGTWDDANKGVIMLGKVIKNDSTFVDVNGIIYPMKEELSINFDAKNTDARFLRKYMDKVVQDLTGNLSGHLRLFGNLNNPTVEGDVFAQNCRFGIGFLNTFYTFTDSVKCLPDTIKIKNISIYDEKGNKAIANGYLKHHLFQNFYFSAAVSYSDFMVFNATKSLNPMFYGTAYGNGTASIYGTEDVINIDVTAQNTENTQITLNFMEEPDIVDYDFIRFVSVKNPLHSSSKKQATASSPLPQAVNTGPEIKFNLQLNATPQATINMITDAVSGDKISGYGNGNLQIQYGTKTPLKVFGNYVIEHGKYNFSLQQLFVRNFDIKDGSSVVFRGNPYTAELGIKAIYTVNANLEDLDRQLKSARNSIPVNCILLLTGPLDHPSIGFDIDLPGANDELARQVKSYIRTDDMMNRQIIYLLVLNRFYTPPENIHDSSKSPVDWSFLSTQLSTLLGALSDKVQLGTNFYQSSAGSQTSTEFELMLSSQLLNNRLIVNGNFGYVNNPIVNSAQNNIPLVGDFDFEYKLTKSGDIRLRGFNRYNFRNYYSITPEMTQGVGILFRKDFNQWRDLLKKKTKK